LIRATLLDLSAHSRKRHHFCAHPHAACAGPTRPSRFHRGELQLDEDGSWEMWIEFSDANYELATSSDDWQFVMEGATIWLASEWSGLTLQATFDGGEVSILYDWCFNGVADVQLVFAR
jgi:hypothetical protein